MLNKIIKLFRIMLVGAMLFISFPFTSYAYVPYVTTGNATSINTNNVTLNGSVNTNNTPTSAWFEYSTNSGLNNSLSTNTSYFNYGYSGNFNATVSGLYPNTIYYFRAVAQNGDGRVYGNIYSFNTNYYSNITNNNYTVVNTSSALNAITNPATSVASKSAKLNSLVTNTIDNTSSSTYFEWGTNTDLGYKTPAVFLGTMPRARHINTITGLAPNTTYYFRAVIQDSASKIVGATLNFTTKNTVTNTSDTTTEKNTENTTITNTSILQPVESALGANVAGSNSFLPVSILGWLIFIILVLILILLSRHTYSQFTNKKNH